MKKFVSTLSLIILTLLFSVKAKADDDILYELIPGVLKFDPIPHLHSTYIPIKNDNSDAFSSIAIGPSWRLNSGKLNLHLSYLFFLIGKQETSPITIVDGFGGLAGFTSDTITTTNIKPKSFANIDIQYELMELQNDFSFGLLGDINYLNRVSYDMVDTTKKWYYAYPGEPRSLAQNRNPDSVSYDNFIHEDESIPPYRGGFYLMHKNGSSLNVLFGRGISCSLHVNFAHWN